MIINNCDRINFNTLDSKRTTKKIQSSISSDWQTVSELGIDENNRRLARFLLQMPNIEVFKKSGFPNKYRLKPKK